MKGTESSDVGLMKLRPFSFLVAWYVFSFTTIVLNKYILTTLQGDAVLLATTQMMVTSIMGFIQTYHPLGMGLETVGSTAPSKPNKRPSDFWRNMFVVGTMRFSTALLGLIALEYVAVSFTETVKSSAPLFTVLITRLVIGESTSLIVNLSLIPIMGGLALCSATELSFDIYGFAAALGTNLSECLQNVLSKLLISHSTYRYSPAELQCYTAFASMSIQIPTCLFLTNFGRVWETGSAVMIASLLLNGLSFHLQTMTAYVLMSYISPVTHSVANTVKRAFIIWLSILLYGNAITTGSGIGTFIVVGGVFVYNKAKEISDDRTPETPPLRLAEDDAGKGTTSP